MGKRYERLDSIVKDICEGVFSLVRIKKKINSMKDSNDLIYIGNELWKNMAEKGWRCNSETILFLRDMIYKANEQTRKLSTRDSLTGLFNRRFLDLKLKMQLASTYRNLDDFFSVIMFDVDNFKKFNDIYGHNAGDAILKTLSGVVLKNLRESDVAFRYGGEEFFILLSDTSKGDALDIAYRLNRQIADMEVTFVDEKGNDQRKKVTISAGVVEINREDPIWIWYGVGGKKLVIDYVKKVPDFDKLLDNYLRTYSGNRSFFSRWGGLSKRNVKRNVKKIGDFIKFYSVENGVDIGDISIAQGATSWIVKNSDNLMYYAKELGRDRVAYNDGKNSKILEKSE